MWLCAVFMLTTTPPPRAAISGSAACTRHTGASTCAASAERRSQRGDSARRPGGAGDAWLTNTSSRPPVAWLPPGEVGASIGGGVGSQQAAGGASARARGAGKRRAPPCAPAHSLQVGGAQEAAARGERGRTSATRATTSRHCASLPASSCSRPTPLGRPCRLSRQRAAAKTRAPASWNASASASPTPPGAQPVTSTTLPGGARGGRCSAGACSGVRRGGAGGVYVGGAAAHSAVSQHQVQLPGYSVRPPLCGLPLLPDGGLQAAATAARTPINTARR